MKKEREISRDQEIKREGEIKRGQGEREREREREKRQRKNEERSSGRAYEEKELNSSVSCMSPMRVFISWTTALMVSSWRTTTHR